MFPFPETVPIFVCHFKGSSYATFEDPFHITASVKNGSDLQWFRPRPIDDQVGVDRKEPHIFVGQILATVTGTTVPARKAIFSRMADSKRSAIVRLVCSLM